MFTFFKKQEVKVEKPVHVEEKPGRIIEIPRETIQEQPKLQELKKPFELTKPTKPGRVVYDESKTCAEQAYTFFDDIYGLNDIKRNMFRAITSEDNIHVMLVGPPATSKTLFLEGIAKKCPNTIYFDASISSGAGFIQLCYENQNADFILVDEVDKMNRDELNCFLSLAGTGTINKVLKKIKYQFKMHAKIFATSNSLTKFIDPLRSRFHIYNLPKYTEDDFTNIIKFRLAKRFNEEICEYIAKTLIEMDRIDPRPAIKAAGYLSKNPTPEDVTDAIQTWIKYATSENVDYN